MPVLVHQGGELDGAGVIAGFLVDFPRYRLRGRIVHVHPAARQSPAAVRAFAHQQHLIAVEDAAAHVDFGRRIAALTFPEGARLAGGDRELERQHLRRQLLQLGVALAIERIAAEGQPVLRQRLQLACPLEQGRRALARAHECGRGGLAA